MSDSLRPHGLQHSRPPCPSPTPGVYSNTCPLSQWCHPTISSSVAPFFSCLQSFPASGSFQMSQLFASGGQSTGVSPCDPAISLLGIYPEKTVIWKDAYTLMLTAALFITVRAWKQPKCSSTEKWIKKMWYMYIMEYYSAIKKEWNNAICSSKDEPRDCHTKRSQTEKDKISYDIIHMWNLICLKKKQKQRYQKETYGY